MSKNISALFLVCCLFLVSCEPQPIPTTVPSAPRSAWLDKFLKNPACQPPCWENITPGETTFTEAVNILSARSDVKIEYQDKKALEWKFVPNGGAGSIGSDDNQLVDALYFGLIGEQVLRVSEVLEVFGSPTYVYIRMDYAGHCAITLGYVPLDMVLHIGQNCSKDKQEGGYSVHVSLQADTLIERILLYPPKAEGVFTNRGPEELEWKGYGEYVREYGP